MQKFKELWEIISRLRKECPWDRKQTNESLKYKLIEEAYEFIDTIDRKDWEKFKSEAGDVLLVILSHIRIAQDRGLTTIEEVITKLIDKLILRHPHVFGERKLEDVESVLRNWEASKGDQLFKDTNFSMPALYLAYRIGEKASRIGFDWRNLEDVWKKVHEEMEELKQAKDEKHVEEEIGDLLFAIANLSRHLGVNPEDALRKANMKFVERFNKMLSRIYSDGKDPSSMTLEELDKYWEEVK